jgi:hypothetical protein
MTNLPEKFSPSQLDKLLVGLPALVARLVRGGSPREIVDARHSAEVLRTYASKAKLGIEAQNAVAQARFRLERRLGEIIPERASRGRPKSVVSDDNFRLADLGISRDLSSRAQAIAAIPLSFFEQYFVQAQQVGFEISAKDFFERVEADRVHRSQSRCSAG